jgi:hypothetical protein
MTTWYVRPDTSHGATRDGTSYAKAWGGWSETVWGGAGIVAGDTLYVCGAHTYTGQTIVGTHGASSDANRVTIRGDYATAPGSITLNTTGWIDASPSYTTYKSLAITCTAPDYYCLYVSGSAGVVVDGCTLIGGDSAIGLSGAVVFTSFTAINNIIHGQTSSGIGHNLTVASSIATNIRVTGNTIYSTSLYGVQLHISSTNSAWLSSQLNDCVIANNIIHDTVGAPINVRSCNNDTVTAPTLYSSGMIISGNTIYNCGVIAGDNGTHGGIAVTGFAWPIISNNTVRNCYVTGAGIQTAKNLYPKIAFNTISGIRSGSPTSQFQNGLPIDGNGIFFDNLTIGGMAYGNRISDLISTGNINSGTALAFWTANGAKYFGNIVEDCYVGAAYGHSSETGNSLNNNTFVNCTFGVTKAGTDALTGNITVKNNIFHKCSAGFFIGANPSITADYNNVYGAMNPYIGISAGANDLNVHPLLDADYRPQADALKRTGANLGGKDYNGKQFYNPPNIGAVDDLTTTPRYGLRR